VCVQYYQQFLPTTTRNELTEGIITSPVFSESSANSDRVLINGGLVLPTFDAISTNGKESDFGVGFLESFGQIIHVQIGPSQRTMCSPHSTTHGGMSCVC